MIFLTCLYDDTTLNLGSAMHVNPKHQTGDSGRQVDDLAAAGVGVQRSESNAVHGGAVARDGCWKGRVQGCRQAEKKDRIGSVRYCNQLIGHRHKLQQSIKFPSEALLL